MSGLKSASTDLSSNKTVNEKKITFAYKILNVQDQLR